jgi:hypothetical protein
MGMRFGQDHPLCYVPYHATIAANVLYHVADHFSIGHHESLAMLHPDGDGG